MFFGDAATGRNPEKAAGPRVKPGVTGWVWCCCKSFPFRGGMALSYCLQICEGARAMQTVSARSAPAQGDTIARKVTQPRFSLHDCAQCVQSPC